MIPSNWAGQITGHIGGIAPDIVVDNGGFAFEIVDGGFDFVGHGFDTVRIAFGHQIIDLLQQATQHEFKVVGRGFGFIAQTTGINQVQRG